MNPRTTLRIEGLAVFAGALAVYLSLDGPFWLLAVLALAPDLSMAGYLAGPALGSRIYNLFHTYTLPLALAGAGVWTGTTLAVLVAAVWTAHIGADRLVGYGLKYETDFKDTHLSAPRRPDASDEVTSTAD
ncbi:MULTISPECIES: DUF4260 domain-containing protein [Salinibaculum]|uniref:DUF4260 domain-containing protein n=1 Tax=Salinibaculum TaxID=2732368 RepID=UPI0030D324A8